MNKGSKDVPHDEEHSVDIRIEPLERNDLSVYGINLEFIKRDKDGVIVYECQLFLPLETAHWMASKISKELASAQQINGESYGIGCIN